MPMIRFQDPKSKSMVGAPSSAIVTFPSGSTVYGPDAEKPSRLRKTESVAKGDLHPDDSKSRPRKAVAKKAPAKKAVAKKAEADG